MDETGVTTALLVREDVLSLCQLLGIRNDSGTLHDTLGRVIDEVEVLKARQGSHLEQAMNARESADARWDLIQEVRRLGLIAQNGRVGMMSDQVTEARHWLLFAGQECMGLREYLITNDMTWAGFILALDSVLNKLEGLREFIAGKAPAPLHRNELGGAGAPPAGMIMAESNARRAAQ